jgi:hypothetical protein
VLGDLQTVTREGGNVVPAVVDAVKAYATMGAFEDEFGSYRENQRDVSGQRRCVRVAYTTRAM